MRLAVLNQLHQAGALKVVDLPTGTFKVGDVNITEEQCNIMAVKLGWNHFELPGHMIISKTESFIKGIMKYITDEKIINETEVVLQNSRRSGTEKYFDRIKMICPGVFDITVLYAMEGVKGKYGVFTSKNHFSTQAEAFRSLKELGTWINTLAG